MKQLSYIDTHAHLTLKNKSDVHSIIQRAEQTYVNTIINVCIDLYSFKEGQKLSDQYPNIFNAAATTPHDVEREGDALFPIFAAAAREKKIVAIGEIGLDYHYKHSAIEKQKEFLKKYLHLALETKLPIILHCRDAFSDLFAITKKEYNSRRAILHCFTGEIADAKKALDNDWLISFSGIITFKNSKNLRDVAAYVPLDHICLETDTPYLTPHSHIGKPNEPSFLPEIAACIAASKRITLEEVAHQTTKNAKQFFSLTK